MNVWQLVRDDLRRILLSVPSLPDVHFELQPAVEPVVGVPYVREKTEQGPAETHTLGRDGLTEERGIYQVDLRWPAKGMSKLDGFALAENIRSAFWHGREIGSAGPGYLKGSVLASTARTPVPSDAWITFPVRIDFYVHRPTRSI